VCVCVSELARVHACVCAYMDIISNCFTHTFDVIKVNGG